MTTLELRDVSVALDGATVLARVGLTVASGTATALLGRSGSGKTTLLRVVAGLQAPDGGSVLVGGQDVVGVPTRERGLAHVPQGAPLLPHRDVAGNLAFPLRLRGMPRTDAGDAARAHGRSFGLGRVVGQRPDQLSTGEQAAAGIARGTVRVPRLLLLDEPVPHLDPRRRAEVLARIDQFRRQHGVTVLVATNDVATAELLADEVAVLDRHHVVAAGPLAEVRRRPGTVVAADLTAPAPPVWLHAAVEDGAGHEASRITTAAGSIRTTDRAISRHRGAALLGIGGRDCVLGPPGTGHLVGTVGRVATTGPRRLVTVDTAAGRVVADLDDQRWLPAAGDAVEVDVRGGLVATPDGTVLGRLR